MIVAFPTTRPSAPPAAPPMPPIVCAARFAARLAMKPDPRSALVFLAAVADSTGHCGTWPLPTLAILTAIDFDDAIPTLDRLRRWGAITVTIDRKARPWSATIAVAQHVLEPPESDEAAP
jgi:hypothetical protein